MVDSPTVGDTTCKTKSEMSEKQKFPKNVVQTRAKGKSKDSGDSGTTKPKTQTDKNYETDGPLATSQANRKPDRDYSSDITVGGPQSEAGTGPVALAVRAERLRQLTPAARSLAPALQAATTTAEETPIVENPVLTSDAESTRSSRRPVSQASQQSTVKRRKTKRDTGVHRERVEPDGITNEELEGTTTEPGIGPFGQSNPWRRDARQPDPYTSQTDNDQNSVRSYGSKASRRSRCSMTSSMGHEVVRELERFRHQIMTVYARRDHSKDRRDGLVRQAKQRSHSELDDVEESGRVQPIQDVRAIRQRSPARQRSNSQRTLREHNTATGDIKLTGRWSVIDDTPNSCKQNLTIRP